MKARRRFVNSRSVGSVISGPCCGARSNPHHEDPFSREMDAFDRDFNRVPLIMMGGMVLLMGGMAVFIASITKSEREARAEKDRAVAKALRDGTLTSYMDVGGPVAGPYHGRRY